MASDTSLDEPKTGLDDADGASESVVDCERPEDFYQPQARDTIARFCQRFLDESALTVTEILHSPRHQQSLSNQATFVSILQQAERVMGRKGHLTMLVNEVARITRERIKNAPPPELTPANYAMTVEGVLHGADKDSGRFMVEAALTGYIFPCRTFSEKAKLLIDIALSTEHEEALAPIDRLLGEMIRSDTATASFCADAPFVRTVDYLVTLVAADKQLDDEAPPIIRGLEALVRRSPMPSLLDGLMAAFRREMMKPNRFTISSAGDLFGVEAVQREITALAALAGRLRTSEGYYGGERTEAALQRRGALLVNEDTLHEIIRGRNFVQKLRTLFMLQKMPLPPTAERSVVGYLKQFLDGRDFASRLLDCWKEPPDKLKGLADVQKMILDSHFEEEDRDHYAALLDDIQSAFIRTQRLLGPLMGKHDPTPDQVLEIVKLAGEKAFCQGKCRATAARALYRQVHRPRFVRAVLLGAAGGKERAARAQWLRGSLAHIGVPFIDLSALRIMVVDDEDGPRNFVESVLHDLGVGTIEPAIDGKDALERFTGREDQYDLIICDWMMPRTSGIDVLKAVREARPDLPFLMVTALATPKAVHLAVENHVSGYIAKPFTPEQLEEKVFLVLTQKGAPTG